MRRHSSAFQFALILACWAMVAIVVPPVSALAGSQPADPCASYFLPNSSDELDKILNAQQAISESIFLDGAASYHFCEEGGWSLDGEVIGNQTDWYSDVPVLGETLEGEPLEVFPFVVVTSDWTEYLSGDALAWATDHNYTISLVGGIVRSNIGSTGFYGLHQSLDWQGERVSLLIPFAETDTFDTIFAEWFGPNPQRWIVGGPLGSCINEAYNDWNACVAIAKNDLAGCMDNLWPSIVGGGLVGCFWGARGGNIFIALVGCGLGALAGGFGHMIACVNAFITDMVNCDIQLQADLATCYQNNP